MQGKATSERFRDHGPVRPRVADEQVLGEVAAAAQLRYPQVDGADAGDEGALAVAVALVAVGACVCRLRVHDLVHERLGHDADELLDVDHPVVESRHVVAGRLPLL